MKRLTIPFVCAVVALSVLVAGCTQATPAPSPTQATAAPKAAEPTKAAPVAQPTAAPAAKVTFPEKGRAITIVVPWPAGGSSDVLTRLLTPGMEKDLGTPVQVVNKPGAGTQIGLTEVAVARPDGYTVGQVVLPAGITVYMDPDRKAAFGRKDLLPVAMTVMDPTMVLVKADSPYKTIKDLADAAKAKPGQIKVADSGIGTTNNIVNVLVRKALGVDYSYVHFEGEPPMVTAVLGDHVDAMVGSPAGVLSPVKSGQLRVLGITGKEESKFFPGVPTFASQGYQVELDASRGYVVPGNTPKEIADRIGASIKKAMDDPEFQKKADEAALALKYMDAAAYGEHWTAMEKTVAPLLPEIKAGDAQKK